MLFTTVLAAIKSIPAEQLRCDMNVAAVKLVLRGLPYHQRARFGDGFRS